MTATPAVTTVRQALDALPASETVTLHLVRDAIGWVAYPEGGPWPATTPTAVLPVGTSHTALGALTELLGLPSGTCSDCHRPTDSGICPDCLDQRR